MCKFLSKSGGVLFQISFFLGDLTRNDPLLKKICIPPSPFYTPELKVKYKLNSVSRIYNVNNPYPLPFFFPFIYIPCSCFPSLFQKEEKKMERGRV